MKVSILTAGKDPHYALGLLSCLVSRKLDIDFIGNDYMQNDTLVKNKNVYYYNLRGDQRAEAPLQNKIIRIVKYYIALVKYAVQTDSKIFHILWLNKFDFIDRIVLNLLYKLLGKKLIFTVHNVNIKVRDGNNSIINRLSLKVMYRLADHLFVHTNLMKQQLVDDFKVHDDRVSVIPFGINNVTPSSSMTRSQARTELTLKEDEKVILFFGNIAPYKGVEFLVMASHILLEKGLTHRLIIAGSIKKDSEEYVKSIQQLVQKKNLQDITLLNIEYIPEDRVEIYLKAADVLILPYRYIFQSGVMFLSYSFGLPVIATDVGSLKEEIIEGKTGYVCKSEDPDDIADKILRYFRSDLYKDLAHNRSHISTFAKERYSWQKVGDLTVNVYSELARKKSKELHP